MSKDSLASSSPIDQAIKSEQVVVLSDTLHLHAETSRSLAASSRSRD